VNCLILPKLTDNLGLLYKGQQENETKSLLFINGDNNLKENLHFFEMSLNLLFDITKTHKNINDNELTIQYIGIRLFNNLTAALRLLLFGYYQLSYSAQRDVVEVSFLLDYFSSNTKEISAWKTADAKAKKKYKPEKIRNALDERDKLKKGQGQRDLIYKMFCEYAAHATYVGNKLVAPKGLGIIGPFYDEKHLKCCFGELVKWASVSSLYYKAHFSLPEGYKKLEINYLLEFKHWWERTYKTKVVDSSFDDLRTIKYLIDKLGIL